MISPYITGIIIEEEVSQNVAHMDSFVIFTFPTEHILHLAGGLLDIGRCVCGERRDFCVSGTRRGAGMELPQKATN